MPTLLIDTKCNSLNIRLLEYFLRIGSSSDGVRLKGDDTSLSQSKIKYDFSSVSWGGKGEEAKLLS